MPSAPTRYDPQRTGNQFLQFYEPHNVFHPGVDLNMGVGFADEGQRVECPAAGIVEYVSLPGDNGGLGLYVVISHPDFKVWTRYMHLKAVNEGVKAGTKLAEGQSFALLGHSGTSSPHLHFEVLNDKGLRWIKDYKRPYGRYPTGLSRETVASMWLDPIEWMNTPTASSFVSELYRLSKRALALRLERLAKRLRGV